MPQTVIINCSKLLTWLKRVHAQSCFLNWKGCMLKIAYLIVKGTCLKLLTWLKRAHAQSCLLDWTGCTPSCLLDWTGHAPNDLTDWTRRPPNVLTDWTGCAPNLVHWQFEHTQAKGEWTRGVGQKLCIENRSAGYWLCCPTNNMLFIIVRTRCTYMSNMELGHQGREDKRWTWKWWKRGRILFKGNASPTVPGALERKQVLLLCVCPRLFAGKGVHKKVGRKSTNEEFSLRATHP
jgi:hypothetical protein